MDDDILRGIEARAAERETFLAALVRQPSDNPPGDCAPHAVTTRALIEALGFTVESHAVPDDLCRAHGMTSAINLVVRRRFGDGPVIALNAHGDVVPPGEGWSRDPYGAEVHAGEMYGRGVAVSKSDIATYCFALLALESVAEHLGGAIEIHVTYDEEVGGMIGPKWLLDEGLSKPDLALSAGFSYAVVTAHNGCLHLEVSFTGRSAHAAEPASGADALEAASAVLAALYEERRGYAAAVSAVPGIGHPNLVVGLIEGGINTNVVPDKVALRLDRRMVPEEDPGAVENRLRDLIERAADGVTGVEVAIRRVMLARPLEPLPGHERLVAPLVARAGQILGAEIASSGVPLYTDARHYAERGIPTVLYGAGPRSFLEANAHRADEKLALADLDAATKVVALALSDLLRID